jgi:fibronectin type 3 domain-containing protein
LTNKIVSGTQYIDRNVEAGRTYTYSVTSVDFKGIESNPSANITVTVPTTTPPAKQ